MRQEQDQVLMVRQPVFDSRLKIVAYQLRYQYSEIAEDSLFDPDTEGSLLLMHTFTSFCQDGQICRVPLFIPFPNQMLQDGKPLLLPQKEIVIEVNPDLEVTPEVVEHLKQLSEQGYRLALDRFSLQPDMLPLVRHFNIVKVDFSLMSRKQIIKLVKALTRSKITALAQNVDDFETLKFCKSAGFKLFQGRFISRPAKVLGKDVPGNSAALIQLLQQLQRDNITPAEIEELIIMDPKLSFKMLRVVNSAAYRRSKPIESMHQAVVLLGHDQIKKWATLITLAGNTDKPEVLSRNLLVRGRMCELLAEASGRGHEAQAFMVGMISQLDLLLDVEMTEILRQVPLQDTIKQAIAERAGILGELLAAVEAFEEGNWQQVEGASLDKAFFEVAYRHSLHWADQALLALSEAAESA